MLSCGGVVIAPMLRAGEGASWLLGAVVVGAGHPLELSRARSCRLDILSGLASHWGQSLHVYPIVVLGREGSCALMLGSSRCDDAMVVPFPPPVVAVALDGAMV